VTITPGAADRILEAAGMKLEDLKKKIETSKKPASREIPGALVTMTSTLKTQMVRGINVVGVIEGSDPALKNEAVVIGAHLDHEGRWEDYIYNGADDNGSGSVGVLNLARAFAANPQKPKRTLVFCLWCGEEEGLLGSKYFVANPPTLLKAKIVSYLNFDMMSRPYDEKSMAFAGRMMEFSYGPEFIKKVKPANFVPVSFPGGAGFGEIIRAANQYVGLDVYVREAKRTDVGFGDSDHTSFHEAKIPWVWPFTAVTEDLHQTSDSADKVSGELMEKVSKLMYVIAWLAADK
jgi:Zn-dependent M28 family amino/carboxypeptidase